ncbi:uncharacterized protein G2W53_037118 [Senna tora]|uniref:Uncharacterized protein n=1 Tax=Senna tora TaxID=362788 RepID=A0A834SX04_9FABA|nr:uncharacterized protein G2W53_037118 [Senna tora]
MGDSRPDLETLFPIETLSVEPQLTLDDSRAELPEEDSIEEGEEGVLVLAAILAVASSPYSPPLLATTLTITSVAQ